MLPSITMFSHSFIIDAADDIVFDASSILRQPILRASFYYEFCQADAIAADAPALPLMIAMLAISPACRYAAFAMPLQL
jgi:hypothetical protein